MNKLLNIAYGSFIAIVVYLALCLLFVGCDQPESFHIVECKRTPGDLYSYACETPGYERCWNPNGTVKYADCEYMGIMCVTSCAEVD